MKRSGIVAETTGEAKTMQYRINEVFQSLQGEGSFTGLPAIFVRLQGCPVACPWCDTRHTWDVNSKDEVALTAVFDKQADSPHWAEADATLIAEQLHKRAYRARHVVITGGEPCIYDLRPLCDLLHQLGYRTQVETSGTFPVQVPDDTWVTVSPKVGMKGGYAVRPDALRRADEIKHPVAMSRHVDELKALLADAGVEQTPVFLQPISQQQRATQLAIAACIENNWRLSVQLHKYLGIE